MFFLTLALIEVMHGAWFQAKNGACPWVPLAGDTLRVPYSPPPYFKILCDALLIDALMQNEELLCYISCVVLDIY